jgi:hypothetical protein
VAISVPLFPLFGCSMNGIRSSRRSRPIGSPQPQRTIPCVMRCRKILRVAHRSSTIALQGAGLNRTGLPPSKCPSSRWLWSILSSKSSRLSRFSSSFSPCRHRRASQLLIWQWRGAVLQNFGDTATADLRIFISQIHYVHALLMIESFKSSPLAPASGPNASWPP